MLKSLNANNNTVLTVKILKIWTPKNCCNYPKIGTVSFYYRMGPKDVDGIANSEDPDQTRLLL